MIESSRSFPPSRLLCAVALAISAASVHAQTELTLYGIADVYAAIQKGDRTESRVESGGLSGSRIGFAASHDLGGGLKAIAKIEAGVGIDSGTSNQGGRTWGRQAWAGLSGTYGTITLGRQYALDYNATDTDDPFETGAGSSQSSGIVTSLGGVRADNAILYQAPAIGSFSTSFMFAAGESSAGRSNDNSLLAGNVRYASGPLGVGLTYSHLNRADDSGINASDLLLAGTYDAGVVKVMAGVQGVRNGSRLADTADDRTEVFAGVHVPTGSEVFWLGAGSGKTHGLSGSRATQASAAWLHSLDKSTTVYGVLTGIHNGSLTNYTVDSATGSGPAVSPGRKASAIQVGLRYKF